MGHRWSSRSGEVYVLAESRVCSPMGCIERSLNLSWMRLIGNLYKTLSLMYGITDHLYLCLEENKIKLQKESYACTQISHRIIRKFITIRNLRTRIHNAFVSQFASIHKWCKWRKCHHLNYLGSTARPPGQADVEVPEFRRYLWTTAPKGKSSWWSGGSRRITSECTQFQLINVFLRRSFLIIFSSLPHSPAWTNTHIHLLRHKV